MLRFVSRQRLVEHVRAQIAGQNGSLAHGKYARFRAGGVRHRDGITRPKNVWMRCRAQALIDSKEPRRVDVKTARREPIRRFGTCDPHDLVERNRPRTIRHTDLVCPSNFELGVNGYIAIGQRRAKCFSNLGAMPLENTVIPREHME